MRLSDPRACWVSSSSVLAARWVLSGPPPGPPGGFWSGPLRCAHHSVGSRWVSASSESNHAHAVVIRACFAEREEDQIEAWTNASGPEFYMQPRPRRTTKFRPLRGARSRRTRYLDRWE
jgi:hypothetical protein